MPDWSGALAHAFKCHLEAGDQGERRVSLVDLSPLDAHHVARGTTGTTEAAPVVPGVVRAKPTGSLGFVASGTTGTSGTTQNDIDLHEEAGRSDVDAFEERAAIVEDGAGVPRIWAEALARLDLAARPQGEPDDRWRQLMDDAGRFLDRWGADAARLGWSAIDVFGTGVDRSEVDAHPGGLVPLIRGGFVESIARDRATIRMPSGGVVVYLRRPCAGSSSEWERAEESGPPPGALR